MTVVGGVNAAQIVAGGDLFKLRPRLPRQGLAAIAPAHAVASWAGAPSTAEKMMDETDEGARLRGRFPKGKSGNPAGRPKQPKSAAEVRTLAREKTVQMVEVLTRVALNPKSPPAARTQAATELLNRGWGRPNGDFGDGAEGLIIKVVKFADQQLEASEMKVIEHDDSET
jgi:hypothetical protein